MISEEYVKRYCGEDLSLIENYDKAVSDTDATWHLHHRLETHDESGKRRGKDITPKELKRDGMYYKRPAAELIFLTEQEHKSLHMVGNDRAKGHNIGNSYALGNRLSADVRRRMGLSRMGNKNNGCAFIRCVETGETHRTREWIALGFQNAYSVAKGRQKTCRGLRFEYVTTD